jgi:hypothetical protein
MASPPIFFKTHGIALEMQIGDHVCYFNPYEEYSDRRPENADAIISFVPQAVTDLNVKSVTGGLLGGLDCFSRDDTQVLTDQRLRTCLQGTGPTDLAAKFLRRGRPIDGHIFEWGDSLVGLTELKDNGGTYAVRMAIDDVEIDYFPVAPASVDAFLGQSSTCAVLVLTDWWKTDLEVLRRILSADRSTIYYIGSETFRKKDLDTLCTLVLPKIAEKIVCRKQKWAFPADVI